MKDDYAGVQVVEARRRDIRRHDREEMSERLRLGYTDQSGNDLEMLVYIDNISQSGAKVIAKDPIPMGTYVVVNGKNGAIACRASVRFCRPAGLSYMLGLEFSGFRYDPNAKPPKYD